MMPYEQHFLPTLGWIMMLIGDAVWKIWNHPKGMTHEQPFCHPTHTHTHTRHARAWHLTFQNLSSVACVQRSETENLWGYDFKMNDPLLHVCHYFRKTPKSIKISSIFINTSYSHTVAMTSLTVQKYLMEKPLHTTSHPLHLTNSCETNMALNYHLFIEGNKIVCSKFFLQMPICVWNKTKSHLLDIYVDCYNKKYKLRRKSKGKFWNTSDYSYSVAVEAFILFWLFSNELARWMRCMMRTDGSYPHGTYTPLQDTTWSP